MHGRFTWAAALIIFAFLVVLFTSVPYYGGSRTFGPSPNVQKPSNQELAKATGSWEDELRNVLSINSCNTALRTGYHPHPRQSTVFTSYPRSGNTHLRYAVSSGRGFDHTLKAWPFYRNLVELSSGFYTSSIICDDVELQTYFPAECATNNTFLLKAHFPVFQHEPMDEKSEAYLNWWKQFDRVLWVQRNPFDSIFSLWNLMRFIESGAAKHEGRVELPNGKLTWEHNSHAVFELTYMYCQHYMYWRRVPLPMHKVRYEDLLGSSSVPTLMGILNFLLRPTELPSLEAIICADEGHTAYKGGKNQPLYAYEKFDKRLQDYILRELAQPWCAGGYDLMLKEKHDIEPVNCQTIDMFSGEATR